MNPYAFNQTAGWKFIIVIPVSISHNQARRGPTVVSLPAGTAGLPSDCSAICHQVTTLDRAKLTDHIGVLPAAMLATVGKALLAAVDIRR
jgi:mRNA-degrading endonuclease toxin of MazEF toxin-antitoxin module